MQTIQMSDIYGQYLTMKDEIDAAIQEVIRSTKFIKSGKVLDFEEKLSEYLDTNVISCGNGTDALQLAFMALNLNPGDEIITTPFTFISTVEVLVLLELKPVFVDVCPNKFNIDSSKIEAAITDKTKAILPVHLFGQCADLETIQSLCKKHNLFLVEDACQALGTGFLFNDGTTKKAGTVGDIGCNSFFPSKNLGAFGDGGAVYTNDNELAKTIRSIANHGRKEMYVYERVGLNSRLDSMQAAILEVKLKSIEKHIKARQEAAAFYDFHLKGIEGLQIPTRAEYSTHTFHQYTIKVEKRDELQAFLQKREIPSMVYYPRAIHLQEGYQFLEYKKGDFPHSEKLTETVLSLPMHTELTEEQQRYIVDSIKEFFKNEL
ncbi:aminotransferase class I/II-fold pyridoxal phosphate-dependent enzyme [Maribellus comscasis]|uniref:Aminotransferase class I/II-fold pyridoxal phosphate-dependent enzyme n=1 Tax=Maribellus comscasis TaxID=2681766 RepID=A0A6I6JTM4_9BACT|nr:DegT/DnrJ/EryC1/StrS family aminotransferase [Maribellus comscasis]QGY44450.1 aminotransferase class I/II-fold pyridoxal phosphate-dependent enzyme [Maribellus comscasis]